MSSIVSDSAPAYEFHPLLSTYLDHKTTLKSTHYTQSHNSILLLFLILFLIFLLFLFLLILVTVNVSFLTLHLYFSSLLFLLFLVSIYNSKSNSSRLFIAFVLFSLLILNYVLYEFLLPFECLDAMTKFAFDSQQLENSLLNSNSSIYYVRMTDSSVRWEWINQQINEIQFVFSSGSSFVHSLSVSNVNIWNSEALRFQVILFYWKFIKQQTKQNHELYLPRFFCLLESDVVVRPSSLIGFLDHRIDYLWIQHLHSHKDFESINFGLFCVQSHSHDKVIDKWKRLRDRVGELALQWIATLSATRYRRFLPYSVLFSIFPRHFLFSWSDHGGCSKWEENKSCNYIHFTHPKLEGIQEALTKSRTMREERQK
jgi:hypothetical protein